MGRVVGDGAAGGGGGARGTEVKGWRHEMCVSQR